MNAVISNHYTRAGVDDMKSKNISRNFAHVRVFSLHEISEIREGMIQFFQYLSWVNVVVIKLTDEIGKMFIGKPSKVQIIIDIWTAIMKLKKTEFKKKLAMNLLKAQSTSSSFWMKTTKPVAGNLNLFRFK